MVASKQSGLLLCAGGQDRAGTRCLDGNTEQERDPLEESCQRGRVQNVLAKSWRLSVCARGALQEEQCGQRGRQGHHPVQRSVLQL